MQTRNTGIGKVGKQAFTTALAFALTASAHPAAAHHVMDGATPNTWLEGLLSGLAHPVIGLDHLAFVVAIGILAFITRRWLALPLTFAMATLAGTALHVAGIDLPYPEAVIAASVIAAAVLILHTPGKIPGLPLLLTAIGAAGLFHGYAYGESIVGAKQEALAAYLIGFYAIQIIIAVTTAGTMNVITPNNTSRMSNLAQTTAGIVIAIAGITAIVAQTGML